MCSPRHARRLWEKAGGKEVETQNEDKLVNHILEMHNQGMSNLAIANALNIHESKVRRILRQNNI